MDVEGGRGCPKLAECWRVSHRTIPCLSVCAVVSSVVDSENIIQLEVTVATNKTDNSAL